MTDTGSGRDIGVDSVDHATQSPIPVRTRSGVLLAVIAVAVGVGAMVLAFGGSSPEHVADESEPTIVPVPSATPTRAPLPSVVSIESVESSPAARSVAQEEQRAEQSARIAELMANEVDTDRLAYGIAYVTDDGLMLINRSGAIAPELEVAQNFGLVLGLPLFAADRQTWAIDPRDAGSAHLVTSSFVVVQSKEPNVLAVFDAGRHEIELLASGQPAPGIELPAGARVLPVQGRGLLVLPRTGGTFEVDGLAASLRRIDDGVAVAASRGATLFQRCDERLQCELVLRSKASTETQPGTVADAEAAADGQVVALDLRKSLSVSPLGTWVVEYGNGENRLFSSTSNSFMALAGGEIQASSWASDERFVALLRNDEIELFFPEDNWSFWLDLAAPAATDAIAVYSSVVLAS